MDYSKAAPFIQGFATHRGSCASQRLLEQLPYFEDPLSKYVFGKSFLALVTPHGSMPLKSTKTCNKKKQGLASNNNCLFDTETEFDTNDPQRFGEAVPFDRALDIIIDARDATVNKKNLGIQEFFQIQLLTSKPASFHPHAEKVQLTSAHSASLESLQFSAASKNRSSQNDYNFHSDLEEYMWYVKTISERLGIPEEMFPYLAERVNTKHFEDQKHAASAVTSKGPAAKPLSATDTEQSNIALPSFVNPLSQCGNKLTLTKQNAGLAAKSLSATNTGQRNIALPSFVNPLSQCGSKPTLTKQNAGKAPEIFPKIIIKETEKKSKEKFGCAVCGKACRTKIGVLRHHNSVHRGKMTFYAQKSLKQQNVYFESRRTRIRKVVGVLWSCNGVDSIQSDDEVDDMSVNSVRANVTRDRPQRYICKLCRKVFGTYNALQAHHSICEHNRLDCDQTIHYF